MLLYHLYCVEPVCIGMLIISLLVAACTLYAYSIDSQRPADDPKKKNYHLGALLFTLFTWPIFLFAFIFIFVMRAVLYGFFFIFFTLFLIFIPRESTGPTWVEKKAASLGEWLLEANMFLIRLFLRPWTNEPETI